MFNDDRMKVIKFKVVKTAFDSRLENLVYKLQTTNVRRRLVKAVSLNDYRRNYL